MTSIATDDFSISGSVIERISGSSEGKPGYRDGSATEALFNHPRKLTLDSDGTIYVADTKNAAVRMITRAGKHIMHAAFFLTLPYNAMFLVRSTHFNVNSIAAVIVR